MISNIVNYNVFLNEYKIYIYNIYDDCKLHHIIENQQHFQSIISFEDLKDTNISYLYITDLKFCTNENVGKLNSYNRVKCNINRDDVDYIHNLKYISNVKILELNYNVSEPFNHSQDIWKCNIEVYLRVLRYINNNFNNLECLYLQRDIPNFLNSFNEQDKKNNPNIVSELNQQYSIDGNNVLCYISNLKKLKILQICLFDPNPDSFLHFIKNTNIWNILPILEVLYIYINNKNGNILGDIQYYLKYYNVNDVNITVDRIDANSNGHSSCIKIIKQNVNQLKFDILSVTNKINNIETTLTNNKNDNKLKSDMLSITNKINNIETTLNNNKDTNKLKSDLLSITNKINNIEIALSNNKDYNNLKSDLLFLTNKINNIETVLSNNKNTTKLKSDLLFLTNKINNIETALNDNKNTNKLKSDLLSITNKINNIETVFSTRLKNKNKVISNLKSGIKFIHKKNDFKDVYNVSHLYNDCYFKYKNEYSDVMSEFKLVYNFKVSNLKLKKQSIYLTNELNKQYSRIQSLENNVKICIKNLILKMFIIYMIYIHYQNIQVLAIKKNITWLW